MNPDDLAGDHSRGHSAGHPPNWGKSRAYRSRAAREPRAAFGAMRWLFDEEALAALVARHAMIGTTLPATR
jgi:hypothetical protein